MADFSERFLELLEKMETDIANLYKLFADKFPVHKQLWDSLNKDELSHAAYIKKLSAYFRQGLVFLDNKQTRMLTIKFITDGIKQLMKKLKPTN